MTTTVSPIVKTLAAPLTSFALVARSMKKQPRNSARMEKIMMAMVSLIVRKAPAKATTFVKTNAYQIPLSL